MKANDDLFRPYTCKMGQSLITNLVNRDKNFITLSKAKKLTIMIGFNVRHKGFEK